MLLNSIRPIVEYFPIDAVQKRVRWYAFDEKEHVELTNILNDEKVIYAFYNSEGRLIYLGKAETTIFGEMTQTFNRSFSDNYVIFAVKHPRERYKPKPNGGLRQISKQEAILADTAKFFSAYSVSPELIVPLESLLIRICANNLINTRMEQQLRPFGQL
jgi:hypothetical protein